MRQPNLKDVAKAAGVHVATASRALNERTASMVSPETVDRVRRAAETLGYRVNRVARGLKTRRSFTVGMLIPDITNPFLPPMVRGAEDGLAEAGYTLVLADTDNDEEKDRQAQAVLLERQVDGMLLATARRRDPLVEELIGADVPLVLVNRTIDRGGVAAVIPDDHAGMALAVDHLHDLGHRGIGHVAGPGQTSTGARRAA
jgi:LacI family transcriptional regulator